MEPDSFDKFNDLIIPNLIKTPNFSSTFSHIDWKIFASVNLEELVQSYDLNILNKLLPYIVFCNIENEFTERIEPIFLKLYRVAQIMIEYFIHSQQQYVKHFNAVRNEFDQIKSKYQMLMTTFNKKQMHARSKSRRKSKMQVQSMKSSLGNHGLFPCDFCGKQFYTQIYLSTHIDRRHSDESFDRFPSHILGDGSLTISNPNKEPASENLTQLSRIESNLIKYTNERIMKQYATLEKGLHKLVLDQEIVNRDHLQEFKNESENFELFKQCVLTQFKEQGIKNLELENSLENYQEIINGTRPENKSSNLGELEDDTLDIPLYTTKMCELSNQLQKYLDNIHQTDGNSLGALAFDNSINAASEGKFEQFQSEILAKNFILNENSSIELLRNHSQTMNIPLSSRLNHLQADPPSNLAVKFQTSDCADDIIHDKSCCFSTLDIQSQPLPLTSSADHPSPSPIGEIETILSTNSDVSPNFPDAIFSRLPLGQHKKSIAVPGVDPEFHLDSIFFSEHEIYSFLPYPISWSRLKSRFSLDFTKLDVHRREVRSLFLQQLSKNCILPEHLGVSTSQFFLLMNSLKYFQDKYSNNLPEFYTLRRIIENDLLILIDGMYDSILLSQTSITNQNSENVFSSLKKVTKPIKQSVSDTSPALHDPPIKFESSQQSLTSTVIEIDDSSFRFEKKMSRATSWNSDNSGLEQDYNNLLSDFTEKYSPLPNSVITVNKDDSPKTKPYNEYEFQSGSIPSDFSLSDVTIDNMEIISPDS